MKQIKLMLACAVLGLIASSPISLHAQDNLFEALQKFNASATTPAATAKYCLGVRYLQHPVAARITFVNTGGPADGQLKRGDWVLVTAFSSGGRNVLKAIGWRRGYTTLGNAIVSAESPRFGLIIVRNGQVMFKTITLEPCKNRVRSGSGTDDENLAIEDI